MLRYTSYNREFGKMFCKGLLVGFFLPAFGVYNTSEIVMLNFLYRPWNLECGSLDQMFAPVSGWNEQ